MSNVTNRSMTIKKLFLSLVMTAGGTVTFLAWLLGDGVVSWLYGVWGVLMIMDGGGWLLSAISGSSELR